MNEHTTARFLTRPRTTCGQHRLCPNGHAAHTDCRGPGWQSARLKKHTAPIRTQLRCSFLLFLRQIQEALFLFFVNPSWYSHIYLGYLCGFLLQVGWTFVFSLFCVFCTVPVIRVHQDGIYVICSLMTPKRFFLPAPCNARRRTVLPRPNQN